MTLAPYVQILARGPGRSRHLTRPEARAALGLILSGAAQPEAVGAVLMLMRFRGENADEIAGFVEAIRDSAAVWPGPAPALDWPSYAAGRSRGLPWFLLAARLVAAAGYPVLLHGWNSADGAGSVRDALASAGIARAETLPGAADRLASAGIVYLPLERVAPEALRVLRLREVLGLRSPVNTALRLFNPGGAACSVQGVFHPPYRGLQTDAAALLGQPDQMVLKGAGGEFERAPAKEIALMGLRLGVPFDGLAPALLDAVGRLAEGPGADDLGALWAGTVRDAYAEAIVTGTAAVALMALGHAPGIEAADRLAQDLWNNRPV